MMLSTRDWSYAAIPFLAVGLFALGRFAAPKAAVKIVTQEHVVTVTKEVKGDTKEVQVNKTVVVYRDRIRKPDGTVETKEKVVEGVVSDTQDKKTDSVDSIRTADVKQTTTITPSRDNWHVSALAGTGWPLGLVLGASAERRILGPIYVGGWGLVETTGKNPMAGVSVGLGF